MKDSLRNLTEKLTFSLQPHLTQLSNHMMRQLKKYVIAIKLKTIPKLNQPSFTQDTSLTKSSARSIEYQIISRPQQHNPNYHTIKPMDQNYTSLKVLTSEGFNFNAQNILEGNLEDIIEETYEKPDYMEKYLNQTKKLTVFVHEAPTSEYALKNLMEYNPTAMERIQQSYYTEFLGEILNKQRDWVDNTKDPMKYSREPISSPLTRIDEAHTETALETFKELLQYDESYLEFPRCVLAANIVNKVKKYPEELIEQTYIQILRQLKGPRFQAYIQLLAVFASVIKVPLRFYFPLLNYCTIHHQNNPQYFTYIFYLLIKNFDKPRQNGILPFQAQMIMHLKKIPIIFDLPTQKLFYVQTTTKVQELVQQLTSYFQLDKTEHYLINFRHGYLESGNLFDGFYSVQTDKSKDNLEELHKRFNGFRAILIFKNITCSMSNNCNMSILYTYEAKKYLTGIYSLRRREIVSLAAYKYYAENDSVDLADMSLYFPYKHLEYFGEKYCAELLVHRLKDVNCTKKEARRQFLRELKRKDCFMAHIFSATVFYSGMEEVLHRVLLFVSPGLIHFLGASQSPTYKRIRLDEIREWGKTRSQLCFKFKGVNQQQKTAHIQSQNQGLVNGIFQNYLQIIFKMMQIKAQNLNNKMQQLRDYNPLT